MNIAYLAAPHTHPDPKIKELRHELVNRTAYRLISQGIMVYSPLTHNIPLDALGIHGDWLTWKDFDLEMLSRCDRLIVLKLPGWEVSKGVAAEIAHAKELGLPIEWLEEEEVMVSLFSSCSDSSSLDA